MRRYAQFSKPLTAPDGTTYLSGLQYMDFLYSGNIKYHEVTNKENGRLDLIAYAWLGDPTLWWIIATLNGIIDPINECSTGTTLAIPVSPIANSNFKPFTYPGT